MLGTGDCGVIYCLIEMPARASRRSFPLGFMEWRQAEHSSLQFNIVGSVLSNSVDKEMNHRHTTSRGTGGGDAAGLHRRNNTHGARIMNAYIGFCRFHQIARCFRCFCKPSQYSFFFRMLRWTEGHLKGDLQIILYP